MNAVGYADQKNISPWAAEAVLTLQKSGIIAVKDGNLFDPQGFIKKEEAARMIAELLQVK